MTILTHRLVVGDVPAAPRSTLYVLHGFLGSGRNWSSIARRLVDLRADWRVVLVDLRLHGDSRGMLGPHTLAACARDVRQLPDRVGREDRQSALLGHSFGGKVALAAAAMLDPPPVQIWVIDSTPDPSSGQNSGAQMLDLVERSPSRFASRDDAVAWIAAGGFDAPTARWMAMNLRRQGDDWVWELDVPGLRDLLEDFASTDLWPVVESPPSETEIRFVHASRGSILSPESRIRLSRIEAEGGPVRVVRLTGGHWLHVDNPEALVGLLADQLPRG
ncbi:MAG: alpha/beta hydrolase [Gemmatimonadota bacterium]|nr:alpha/beta hydrolase [Gemmatimonadota bacterium]MDH3426904.1 alpha/beta hydrolase [Gemmatimonadota bacterium]